MASSASNSKSEVDIVDDGNGGWLKSKGRKRNPNGKAVEEVRLKSSDGKLFNVSASVMRQADTIRHMLDDDCATDIIPLPNVKSPILFKIIQYCTSHAETKNKNLMCFDNDFVNVDQETLFDLLLAANYMSIQSLVDLICKTIADQMRGKTVEELRSHFHIVNDFTEEEEEEIRRENSWAFE